LVEYKGIVVSVFIENLILIKYKGYPLSSTCAKMMAWKPPPIAPYLEKTTLRLGANF
jgi:hypothetical protein